MGMDAPANGHTYKPTNPNPNPSLAGGETAFCGVTALLAVQTDGVISKGGLCVCLSVCPTVRLHIPVF